MSNIKKFFAKLWKRPLVRIVACVLAAVMVFGLCFSLFNQGDVEREEPNQTHSASVDKILVSNCDSVDGFSPYSTSGLVTFGLNTEIRRTGYASLSMTCNGSIQSGKGFTVYYRPEGNKPVDISAMTHLCFDFYVSDASQFNGNVIAFELGSNWSEDIAEVEYYHTFSDLVDGWNHIELDMTVGSSMTEGFAPSGDTTAPYDNTGWKRLRFYNYSAFEATDLLLAIDNIYFTNRPTSVDLEA